MKVDRRTFLKGTLSLGAVVAAKVPLPAEPTVTVEPWMYGWKRLNVIQLEWSKVESIPLPIEQTLEILQEEYMKFWIVADNTKQGKVDAEDADEAMEVWLNENGFDSIEHAADEFFIDICDFDVIPVENSKRG